ncbi:MAG: HD domain-containing protein [Anaerolineae bacterium]|nr:HD domain-containing protein [Anaerolineae bacterium]
MHKQILFPDSPLRQVRALAEEHGVEVWPVGGAVRDALLDRPIHDWDVAVEGDAIGLARAVADALGGAFYPLDVERDAGRVVLDRPPEPRMELDFAALRGPNLEADLRGRDFTINAMAVTADGQLVDPTGGWADLQARLVRAPDETAFDDDPLRMLRAVRLVAELPLKLEAKTAAWIIQRAHTLHRAAPERIRDEIARTLAAPDPAGHLHMLDELGLLEQVIPEIAPLKGQEQSPPHRFDVWWHSLQVVDGVAAVLAALEGHTPQPDYADPPPVAWDDVAARLGRFATPIGERLQARLKGGRTAHTLLHLAALGHDLGKPLTCSQDREGRLHFYSHDQVGAEIVAARLQALRFSHPETEWVERVVLAHLRPAHLARVKGAVTRRAIYRFFRATGAAGVGVVLLSLADHLATWGPHLQPGRWERRLEVAERLLCHYFERQEDTIDPPALLSGHDLIAQLGLAAGPELGRLLEKIREAQAAGEVQNKEEALALARAIAGGNKRTTG